MWTIDDAGDLTGRTALVTGANCGIGFHTARRLRGLGATVVLACRDAGRASAAAAVLEATPGPPVHVIPLDLASLASVRSAAERLREVTSALDLLVCNAGVMMAPPSPTEDGFEVHLGVNHLGHFALTGRLLDLLVGTPGSRVVVVGSAAARMARLSPDAFTRMPRRPSFAAYASSKLANLLFAQGLHRRLAGSGAPTRAVAAHPGGADTDVVRHVPRLASAARRPQPRPWTRLLTHRPEQAALSVVRAATDLAVEGGAYIGPDGPLGLTGAPVLVPVPRRARDQDLQDRLWTASEAATSVLYRVPART